MPVLKNLATGSKNLIGKAALVGVAGVASIAARNKDLATIGLVGGGIIGAAKGARDRFRNLKGTTPEAREEEKFQEETKQTSVLDQILEITTGTFKILGSTLEHQKSSEARKRITDKEAAREALGIGKGRIPAGFASLAGIGAARAGALATKDKSGGFLSSILGKGSLTDQIAKIGGLTVVASKGLSILTKGLGALSFALTPLSVPIAAIIAAATFVAGDFFGRSIKRNKLRAAGKTENEIDAIFKKELDDTKKKFGIPSNQELRERGLFGLFKNPKKGFLSGIGDSIKGALGIGVKQPVAGTAGPSPATTGTTLSAINGAFNAASGGADIIQLSNNSTLSRRQFLAFANTESSLDPTKANGGLFQVQEGALNQLLQTGVLKSRPSAGELANPLRNAQIALAYMQDLGSRHSKFSTEDIFNAYKIGEGDFRKGVRGSASLQQGVKNALAGNVPKFPGRPIGPQNRGFTPNGLSIQQGASASGGSAGTQIYQDNRTITTPQAPPLVVPVPSGSSNPNDANRSAFGLSSDTSFSVN